MAAAFVGAAMGLGLVNTPAWAPAPSEAVAADEGEALDRVILTSGRVVQGRILEETPDSVRIMVMISGIEAPATYSKDEVLKIERGVIEVGDDDAEADDDGDEWDSPADRSSGEGPVVYHLELDGMLISSGGLGRFPPRPVIAPSTLEAALHDAASFDPEIVLIEYDATAPGGQAGVFIAETYGAVVEPFIQDGLRIIFWVENATGGASLLPFSSPEIYFQPGGVMGGLSAVGEIASGDEMVDKKLISATLGHAVGMAIKGGYPPEVMRAMCVESNWLAVRFDRGRPEFLEHEPRESDGEGWIILTDDGEGKNADDETKLDQNDVLNLTADWAYRLGVSKGEFDRRDDLLWELGLDDDYRIEEGRGTSILQRDADRVERTLDTYLRLQEELADLGRGGEARQLNIMRQLKGLLAAQSEVLDPSGAQRAQLDIQIQQLRDAIRQQNRRRR
jgi:hypothetical protein